MKCPFPNCSSVIPPTQYHYLLGCHLSLIDPEQSPRDWFEIEQRIILDKTVAWSHKIEDPIILDRHTQFRNLVDRLKEKYDEAHADKVIAVFCRTENCDGTIEISESHIRMVRSGTKVKISCNRCRFSLCLRCLSPWHIWKCCDTRGVSLMLEENKNNENLELPMQFYDRFESDFANYAQNADVKRCTNCKFYIEKNEG